jgi:STAM-binding protein
VCCSYIKYCDGNSFSGDRTQPLRVTGTDGLTKQLYFRGVRILNAVLHTLAQRFGLRDATQVLLTGCSAGGLAAYLHADRVHEALVTIAPNLHKYSATPHTIARTPTAWRALF